MNPYKSETFEDKSYWLGNDPYVENAPLSGETRADVAVLGGGFTGLTTAYFLKKEKPSLDVAVLEGQVVGFGASGRNAGFSMTLFGLTMSVTSALYGRKNAAAAHRYMEQAVELVESLVRENGIACDYERPGFLRVATTPAYERRIREEIELAKSLGLEGVDWLDAAAVRAQVDSPSYRGAWWEPRCGILNPARLVRGMKAVVERMGVRVYERTPATELRRTPEGVEVATPAGRVRAARAALATNAYSHLVPGLRRRQVPAFTHIVLTEPLHPAHFERIGWKGRQGIEDARNLVHYYRLTADNRLLMGGSDVSISFGDGMDHDRNPVTFAQLEADVRDTFPALKEVAFTHRWGGPVSVPVQMIPALGRLGDERVVYALGCMGHGVSLAHLNGRTLADLLLDRKTERTEVFFANRRVFPWPPEPFRLVLSAAIRGYMRMEDRWNERARREG